MLRSLRQSLVISSDLSQLSQVEAFVDEICDQYQIFNEYYGHIMVCLTEAARNAIIHGNAQDLKKKVSIGFESLEGALVFDVQDRGKGFDADLVPDPTEQEAGETGKGIFLIRSLADSVAWLDEGRHIRFSFMTASINRELAIRRVNALRSYYHEAARKPVA